MMDIEKKEINLTNMESKSVLEMIWNTLDQGKESPDYDVSRVKEFVNSIAQDTGDLNPELDYEIRIIAKLKRLQEAEPIDLTHLRTIGIICPNCRKLAPYHLYKPTFEEVEVNNLYCHHCNKNSFKPDWKVSEFSSQDGLHIYKRLKNAFKEDVSILNILESFRIDLKEVREFANEVKLQSLLSVFEESCKSESRMESTFSVDMRWKFHKLFEEWEEAIQELNSNQNGE